MEYVSSPCIVPDKVENRRYQVNLAQSCLRENTLVILPTGLGKTAVALMVAAKVMENGRKVLMMAPTKPLVDQHHGFFSEMLQGKSVGEMNGLMAPAKRAKIVEENDFIVTTPQTVSNDLDNSLYSLKEFGLIIYDEAHRGTGNYAYVNVATYVMKGTISMGMTASPGSDLKKIEEVCDNLALSRIEVRSDDDPDVSPYVHDTYVNRITVNMPKDLLDISNGLKAILDHYFKELTELHLTNPNWPPSTKHMLSIAQTLQMRLARGEKTASVFRGLTVQAICIKVLHAIDLAETQGMTVLRSYLRSINEDAEIEKPSRADKELTKREDYLRIWELARTSKVEHPKISRILSLISQHLSNNPNSKVIVFTQYRESCDVIAEKIGVVQNARVCKLIGQANGGLKQKDQIGILDKFRNGEYNVIVSTSVGEEGLDITSTNAVIFYEPVPSEIRTIQRRGRTGRKNDGEVYVLIGIGTMDEVMENSAKKKEQMMRERLETLSKGLRIKRGVPSNQKGLYEF
ncbi:MAG: DEAD/DEAH box helicase family protein [archaeon]|nr:DEAD/DEAH box helicase family protein [archaeon]